jgi:hypothetical protein
LAISPASIFFAAYFATSCAMVAVLLVSGTECEEDEKGLLGYEYEYGRQEDVQRGLIKLWFL